MTVEVMSARVDPSTMTPHELSIVRDLLLSVQQLALTLLKHHADIIRHVDPKVLTLQQRVTAFRNGIDTLIAKGVVGDGVLEALRFQEKAVQQELEEARRAPAQGWGIEAKRNALTRLNDEHRRLVEAMQRAGVEPQAPMAQFQYASDEEMVALIPPILSHWIIPLLQQLVTLTKGMREVFCIKVMLEDLEAAPICIRSLQLREEYRRACEAQPKDIQRIQETDAQFQAQKEEFLSAAVRVLKKPSALQPKFQAMQAVQIRREASLERIQQVAQIKSHYV